VDQLRLHQSFCEVPNAFDLMGIGVGEVTVQFKLQQVPALSSASGFRKVV